MNAPEKGRPFKDKLEYFAHDVDMRNDDGLAFLMAKHESVIPYAMYNMILEMIYGSSTGYFLEWNERAKVMISKQLYCPINDTLTILNDALNEDLFNMEMYTKFNILTSVRMQQRYLHMVERRKRVVLIKEYLMINVVDQLKTGCELIKANGIFITSINDPEPKNINVTLNPINVTLNIDNAPINDPLNTQRERERERKVNTLSLSLSEILDFDKYEQIPMLFKNYLQTNKSNRKTDREKINLRLNDKLPTELYNALIECRELATNFTTGSIPDKTKSESFEVLKEKLTGQSWQETICMNYQFEFDEFRDFSIDWLERKRLTNDWDWPSTHLSNLMIDDYKKHIEKKAKGDKTPAKQRIFIKPAPKPNPFKSLENTFNSIMDERNISTK